MKNSAPGPLSVRPIRTRIFRLGESLADFVLEQLPAGALRERSVLAVTSKIVALAERAVVPRAEVSGKLELVRREADHYLGEAGYGVALTIKHGLFIPSAGIDESNAEGDYYILYPRDPDASARELHRILTGRLGIRELGILLTDSHTHPLRRGVTGIGLAHWGFRATRKLIETEDLFGRPFTMTYVNYVDSLSAAAVVMMGEGIERCPLAALEGAPVEFDPAAGGRAEVAIPIELDLYAPIYRALLERAGRGAGS